MEAVSISVAARRGRQLPVIRTLRQRGVTSQVRAGISGGRDSLSVTGRRDLTGPRAQDSCISVSVCSALDAASRTTKTLNDWIISNCDAWHEYWGQLRGCERCLCADKPRVEPITDR